MKEDDELDKKLKRERVKACLNCKKFVKCRNIGEFVECADFQEAEGDTWIIAKLAKCYR